MILIQIETSSDEMRKWIPVDESIMEEYLKSRN